MLTSRFHRFFLILFFLRSYLKLKDGIILLITVFFERGSLVNSPCELCRSGIQLSFIIYKPKVSLLHLVKKCKVMTVLFYFGGGNLVLQFG